ncbi:MAG: hypothetical protein ACPGRZ_11410 [Alphaproteobacteria bacterium]
MLPSVSAGSAALTKYAQAIAAAAPDHAAHDGETAPRPEQDAARQNADNRTALPADVGALEREAQETVRQILEMMRLRVLTALLQLDVPETDANKAANAAVAKLADAIAVNGRHAAQIVHALLERSASPKPDPAASLLVLTAQDLTVILNHETGEIRVELPSSDIAPTKPPPSGAESHHLIDFTDRSPGQAAPALAALGAVHEIARDSAASLPAEPAKPATAVPAATLVSPIMLNDIVSARLNILIQAGLSAPGLQVSDIAAAIARIVSASINSTSPAAHGVPVPEIVASLSRLDVAGDTAQTAISPGEASFSHGRISVATQTETGMVIVRIGRQVTAFAPASLSSPAAAQAPLPNLNALPLPIRDFPADLPVGKVVETPGGLPFVPPDVTDLPVPGIPASPSQTPGSHQPKTTTHTAKSGSESEPFRLLEPVALKNATVVKQMEVASQGDAVRLTRVSVDLSAEIAPGAQAAQQPAPVGGFGLPRPAPLAGEDGPVVPRGYADGSAKLVPVLPAFHARGLMQAPDTGPKPRKLPKGHYEQALLEDPFDRDMPEGHEGLVFSAVVFTA